MKLNYKRTLLVGFAFLSICTFWQMYDSIIPLILQNTFKIGEAATGRVMAIDNILALFMLPLFGHLSDNTRTKLGKRTPYIIFGTVAAVCFMLMLPVFGKSENLLGFALCLGVTLFAMATYRSPAVSLMPDITPKPLRSKGNAIINLMGAVGAVISLALIKFLVPKEGKPDYLPIFAIVAAIMVAAVVILVLTIRENALVKEMEETGGYESTEAELNEELSKGKKMPKDILKSLIFMLLCIAFFFIGYNAVTTFFSLYMTNYLGTKGGDFAGYLMIASFCCSIHPLRLHCHKAWAKKSNYAWPWSYGILFSCNVVFKNRRRVYDSVFRNYRLWVCLRCSKHLPDNLGNEQRQRHRQIYRILLYRFHGGADSHSHRSGLPHRKGIQKLCGAVPLRTLRHDNFFPHAAECQARRQQAGSAKG